ncbi:MAG: M20/M25/M40 family metallo-hydrolase [Bacteroidales bacterium]|nr:M20/M25/M40 family metallo-hydrolase [Candidatus Latescibacterota bacterium]
MATIFKGLILKFSRPDAFQLPVRIFVIHLIAFIFLSSGLKGQSCTICQLTGRIDSGNIAEIIKCLSGEDPIDTGDGLVSINTRYAFSPQKAIATDYLMDLATSYGYSPFIHSFILKVDRPDLTGIAVSPGADTVWVGSMDGDIFISLRDNGWSSFDRLSGLDGRVNELVLSGGGRLWAACKAIGGGWGKIFSSDDGGVTWEMKKDGGETDFSSLNTISFWDEQWGFAAGDHGAFLNTSDGGESWWTEAIPLPYNINGSTALGPFHYLIVTDAGYLFESTDRGFSWSSTSLSPAMARLTDIDFVDEVHGVIVGSGVVFYTSDGGTTWDETAHPAELRCVEMIDSINVVASGGGGEVWISEDGGASWVSLENGCIGTEPVWRFSMDSGGGMWTAGGNEILRVEPGWPAVEDCRSYIVADTIRGSNIVFRKEGMKEPEHRVVLCGHYDSINRETDPLVCAPGADDNASGTACVLECARILSDAWLDRTVEFVLFDGEELGLIGSSAFAAEADTHAIYDALINLDMVGNDYGGTGTALLGAVEDSQDSTLAGILLRCSEDYTLQYTLDWSYRMTHNQPTSDQLSFKEVVDMPVACIIESGYRDNPHYHNCSDLFEFVNMDYIADVARTALSAVAELAGYGLAPAADLVLHQNYPNPFSSFTRVTFEIPREMDVRLSVHDVTGRELALLINDRVDADRYLYIWNGRNDAGSDLSSGVYFIRLKAGGETKSVKAVILH